MGYLLLSNDFLSSSAIGLVRNLRDSGVAYRLIQAVAYLASAVLILCLLGAKVEYKTHIWHSTVKRIVSLYSVLAKLNLLLASCLLYLNLAENIFAVVLAAAIALFDCLFVANYTVKK